jgi:DNA modification methylase
MQDAGWILRNDLIWAKPSPLPRPGSDRLKLSHEHWFHFVHRQPSARPKYYYDLNGSEEGGRDVIVCAPTAGRAGHSAAFPPAVIRPRILSSSPPAGLVLDPFCGTGRALTESLELQRNALGFELSDVYASIAESAVRASLADLTGKYPCSLGYTDVGCHP